MSFLKNYLKPGSGAGKAAEKSNEMTTISAETAAATAAATAFNSGNPNGARSPSPWRRSGAASPRSGAQTPYTASRPASIYPPGDFRNSTMEDILDIKCDVMVNWLHQQQLESMWNDNGPGEGVILKRSHGRFSACPAELAQEKDGLFDAIRKLNVRSALTVNTRVIKLFLARTNMPYVPLADGLRLQILPSVSALPSCQKHHFAAFIADTSLLVVWDDDPRLVLTRARTIEAQLMTMIWGNEDGKEDDEKAMTSHNVSVADLGIMSEMGDEDGGELAENLQLEKPRRVMLLQAMSTAATLALLMAAIGSGWRQIAIEIAVDSSYTRVAFAAVVPLQCWLALFFFQALVGNVLQIFGPIGQVKQNSKFYSGVRPVRIRNRYLPHVTIQAPVYKEGLKAVIEPTIRSIKMAISTYEMQGGTANIFVNDDGMQLLPDDEAQQRRDFYEEHNIGWVARPKHNPKPEGEEKGFVRAGKFKKASNMNYALAISSRVEDKLATIERAYGWNSDDEVAAYSDCLAKVMEEDEGRTWAEGNIRVGDYILIVDSDTRVPADCFLDAVSEMEQSPQVAILQFSSGIMNVTNSFFENGITFFTNLVYTAIAYAVASGDVAPFVGHNAMMRWSAVQDVALECTKDEGYGIETKYWSEETVSEDFDMALRLQSSGYVIRFAGYCEDGFKEGVSLTVYDELARWEKYAYGCNELIFHPLKSWIFKGPFTPLFRRFMGSCMPLPSKFTIMAYIGTYYAIASAWLLTVLNYFIMGWYLTEKDHYYIDSFKIFFSIIVVFTALGNVALAIYRYRLGTRSLLSALWENFRWILMLAIFLGGISMHVSQALISHFIGRDITWGATSKEAENVSFFDEVPRVIRRFKWTFAVCLLGIAGIVILAVAPFVPVFWRINTFVAIFPISIQFGFHTLLPIVLNPNLMLFTW